MCNRDILRLLQNIYFYNVQAERDNEPAKNGAITDINGDINFKNVNFSYPSRNDISVLNGLAFTAHAGEMTALVGPTGCGKFLSYLF